MMGKVILGGLAVLLLSASVPAFPLGTPPTHQKKKDVPKKEPGKRYPDQQQNKRRHPRAHSKVTTPKPVNPGDVPQEKPAKRNPDQKQGHPGPGRTD